MEQHQREDPYPQKKTRNCEKKTRTCKMKTRCSKALPFTCGGGIRAEDPPVIHGFLAPDASPGNPSSLSPQSFTNSTLADSEITSIAGSPYHHAAGQAYPNSQQYPQPQIPKALPIFHQKAPTHVCKRGYSSRLWRGWSSTPAPSQANAPALQLYPAVTAPQFYGESSQAHAPPSPAHVAMAAPQEAQSSIAAIS
ncbi:hypothetical protein BG003_011396, partial [Podila horticola]